MKFTLMDPTWLAILICMAALLAISMALTVIWYLRKRRRDLAKERLKRQIMLDPTVNKSSKTSTFYHHPQFSMMHSSSVPFIPVTVASSQSKIYEMKPPTAAHIYRTPSQSARYPKFNMVNQ